MTKIVIIYTVSDDTMIPRQLHSLYTFPSTHRVKYNNMQLKNDGLLLWNIFLFLHEREQLFLFVIFTDAFVQK